MSIWFDPSLTIGKMQSFASNTMNEYIGIELTELGEDYLKGTMPVDHRTKQAYGLLHGGASVTLAETIGSIASAMVIDSEKYFCVGLEINANHIRSAMEGFVTGTARPVHLGNSTHVWDIRIIDEAGKLVCISRLTVAILKRK
ncbi:MAG TPA: hotdog fold thioesterase [Puia sp.]|nr:hotdog fold thioesterase [Puia sp.]